MRQTMERGKWWVATCGGLGCSPILPGTLGALWGVVIYVTIAWTLSGAWQTLAIAAALLAASGITLALSRWAEIYFGEEDSCNFVTDEVVGFLFTVLLFRTSSIGVTVLAAFPLVRAIDIIKVPPARWLERLPGGWGVLADDLLASVYAAGVLYALRLTFPIWLA